MPSPPNPLSHPCDPRRQRGQPHLTYYPAFPCMSGALLEESRHFSDSRFHPHACFRCAAMPTTVPWLSAGNVLPNSSTHIILSPQTLLYLPCSIQSRDFPKQLNVTGLISPPHLNTHLSLHLTSLGFHLLQRHHLSDFQFWVLNFRLSPEASCHFNNFV